MCDERRATLTTADLEGSRPHQSVSLTLTRMQLYVGIAAQTVAVLAAAVGVGLFLGRIMVHEEFERAIQEFHKVARPQLEDVIDSKIQAHEASAMQRYRDDREELSSRLTAIESHAIDTDRRLANIERKLDWLIENQRK